MEMYWHWLIAIYLFLGGLGAGAYLTSYAAEMGCFGNDSRLKKSGYLIAAPIVALGTLLLVFDLGQGLHKPLLLIGLLSNFGSVMTWGVYILSAFIIVGLVKGFLVFKKKTAPTLLNLAGAVLALATCTYTGLLLAVVKAIPFWNSYLMPFLFVVSALSTGLSVTTLLAHFLEKEKISNLKEGKMHLILVSLEIIIVAIFFGTMNFGINGPIASQSASMVMFESYAAVFWLVFLGLGLFFPLVVQVLDFLRSRQTVLAVTSQIAQHNYLSLATDISVLIGGFTLRVLIVFAAIPIWNSTLG